MVAWKEMAHSIPCASLLNSEPSLEEGCSKEGETLMRTSLSSRNAPFSSSDFFLPHNASCILLEAASYEILLPRLPMCT